MSRGVTTRIAIYAAMMSLVARVFVLAILPQTFANVAPGDVASASGGSQLTTVLCTSHGMMTVSLADLGLATDPRAPSDPPPNNSKSNFCPACLAHAVDFPQLETDRGLWHVHVQTSADLVIAHSDVPTEVRRYVQGRPRAPPVGEALTA